jgi:hypothetical protein
LCPGAALEIDGGALALRLLADCVAPLAALLLRDATGLGLGLSLCPHLVEELLTGVGRKRLSLGWLGRRWSPRGGCDRR